MTRLLHASGVALDALGVAQGPLAEERSRAVWRRAVRALGRLPRHAGALLARARAGRDLRRRAPAVGRIGRRDLRRARPRGSPSRPSARARCSSGSASRSWPPPTTRATTCRARRAGRRPDWSGRVIPTFRPDRYLEPARPGWPELMARLGEVAGVDTGDYAGFVAAHGGAPPALHRPRRDVGRPQPRGRAHRPARARPRPTRIYRAALAGDGHAAPRRSRSAGTCCSRWRGCRARTGW